MTSYENKILKEKKHIQSSIQHNMAIIYIRNVLNPELSVYWSIFIEEILMLTFFFKGHDCEGI